MLEPPKLGWQATSQLAAWEALAEDWPLRAADGGRTLVCVDCGKGVALLQDSTGAEYRYSRGQWLALKVLHLRNHHADLDPDKG